MSAIYEVDADFTTYLDVSRLNGLQEHCFSRGVLRRNRSIVAFEVEVISTRCKSGPHPAACHCGNVELTSIRCSCVQV